MLIYTIGYTKKSLRNFAGRLRNNSIDKIIDIRLNNTSQLAGYAKKDPMIISLITDPRIPGEINYDNP